MNMPGFTAEASCYEAGGQYRMMGQTHQTKAVVPQQLDGDIVTPTLIRRCHRMKYPGSFWEEHCVTFVY